VITVIETERLVKQIQSSYENYAKTVGAEMALEDARAGVKMAAVQRIMAAGDNPMTSKPHSYSSAEAIVNTDREYSDYLGRMREAAVARILAKGKYDAAIAEARLITATTE
jgi:hypothetical protein